MRRGGRRGRYWPRGDKVRLTAFAALTVLTSVAVLLLLVDATASFRIAVLTSNVVVVNTKQLVLMTNCLNAVRQTKLSNKTTFEGVPVRDYIQNTFEAIRLANTDRKNVNSRECNGNSSNRKAKHRPGFHCHFQLRQSLFQTDRWSDQECLQR